MFDCKRRSLLSEGGDGENVSEAKRAPEGRGARAGE